MVFRNSSLSTMISSIISPLLISSDINRKDSSSASIEEKRYYENLRYKPAIPNYHDYNQLTVRSMHYSRQSHFFSALPLIYSVPELVHLDLISSILSLIKLHSINLHLLFQSHLCIKIFINKFIVHAIKHHRDGYISIFCINIYQWTLEKLE